MALRKIVRNRPSLSCSACRRRKIKCQKQRPACDNCARSGDECVYESEDEHREKAAAKKRRLTLDQGPDDGLASDHSRSQSHSSHQSHSHPSRSGSSSPGRAAERGGPVAWSLPLPLSQQWPPRPDDLGPWDASGGDLDFDNFDFGMLTPSLSLSSFQPSETPCYFAASAPLTTPTASQSRRDTPPTSVPSSPPFEGYVSTQDDGSKLFVEGTFWALVSHDRNVYERVLRASSTSDQCKLAHMLSSGESPHMSLPPKHVCDALLQCFFICVHPLQPLIHAPTLAARYGQLRARLLGEHENILPSSLSTADAGFVALLWGIMYAGATASAGTPLAASSKVPDTLAFRDHLHAAFGSAMRASAFPEAPTLDTLVAALIVQSGLGREDLYKLRTAQIVGTCIRAAQQLGLHREASRKGLGAVNSELGRRIWWHLVELDIQSAVVAGTELQAARAEGSSDTRMPAEFLDDTKIGGHDASKYNATPTQRILYPDSGLDDQTVLAGENTAKSSAFLLFAVGRAEIVRVMRCIVVRAYDHQRPRQRDLMELKDMVTALQSRIRAISARLPATGVPEKGLVSSAQAHAEPATHGALYQDNADTNTIFNFWARSVLHLLYIRTSILLQKRFIHEFTGQRQATLWNALVRLCCQYIQSYLRLARWPAAAVYNWSLQSRLQPLEETLILLTYLHTEPSATEADLVEHFAEEVLDMCHNSEQAQNLPPGTAMASRRKLWTILNELKDQAPRRPQADMAWFSTEFSATSLDETITNDQWQNQLQQTSVVDLGGVDSGLASFLQLEGLTDT